MSRGARVAILAAALVATFLVVVTVSAASTVYRAGMLSVSVREGGPGGVSFSACVPGILVRAGLPFVPDPVWSDLRRQAAPWWPFIRAASDGLADAPDGVLVEVRDGTDTVFIAKRGDTLRIEVESDGDFVAVSVPLGAIEGFLGYLEPRGVLVRSFAPTPLSREPAPAPA